MYNVCWRFQCRGVVSTHIEATSERANRAFLSLLNGAGYQLNSLQGTREGLQRNFRASYPADGDMMLRYNASGAPGTYSAVNFSFTFDWTCDNAAVTPPAPNTNSAECLTLAPSGTYIRSIVEVGTRCWVVPCNGTLEMTFDLDVYEGAVVNVTVEGGDGVGRAFMDSSGRVTEKYANEGNAKVWATSLQSVLEVMLFAMSWGCDAPAPALVPLGGGTLAPTDTPNPACTPITTSPLQIYTDTATYQCWLLQCTGTLHLVVRKVGYTYGKLFLHNSDGYELAAWESITEDIASFPADGTLRLALQQPPSSACNVTVEWTCEPGPLIPPTPGYDSAECLTVAPTGSYKRFAKLGTSCWIVPCHDAVDVNWDLGVQDGVGVTLFDSTGSELYTTNVSSASRTVPADGLVRIVVWSSFHSMTRDFTWSVLRLAWACGGGTLPVLPTSRPTEVPPTLAPPTEVPTRECTTLTQNPLNFIYYEPSTTAAAFAECWTFICTGTLHIEVTGDPGLLGRCVSTLFLSDSFGYELDSIVSDWGSDDWRYNRSYPANGLTVLRYEERDVLAGFAGELAFTFAWTCDEAPEIPPADGVNGEECLTVAPTGSYRRLLGNVAVTHCWAIECTGTLAFAAETVFYEQYADMRLVDSTGRTVYNIDAPRLDESNINYDWSDVPKVDVSVSFPNEGVFKVYVDELRCTSDFKWGGLANRISMAWSCNGEVTFAPDTEAPVTSVPTQAPATPAPLTEAPVTDAPGTQAPDTSAPVTQTPETHPSDSETPETSVPETQTPATPAPVTDASETDIPQTEVPITSAPITQTPETHPSDSETPETSVPETQAPATPAPLTQPPVTDASETDIPQTQTPVTSAPMTQTPETHPSDSETPETSVPETQTPATPAPVTDASETDIPQTEVPITSAPITQTPETHPSDSETPETSVPETQAPATPAPLTQPPVTDASETDIPQTQTPVTSAPMTQTPVTHPSDSETPATSVPETQAPATPAPLTEAPATDAPGTQAPDTSAPVTQTPETHPSDSETPETSVPETQAPATPAPVTDASETDIPQTETPVTSTPMTQTPVTHTSDSGTAETLVPLTYPPGVTETPAQTSAPPLTPVSAKDTTLPATAVPATAALPTQPPTAQPDDGRLPPSPRGSATVEPATEETDTPLLSTAWIVGIVAGVLTCILCCVGVGVVFCKPAKKSSSYEVCCTLRSDECNDT